MEILLQKRMGVLKELTEIVYRMNLSVEEMEANSVEKGKRILVKMMLESQEEDYFLFERLVEKFRFSIPEFLDAKLLEVR